MKVKMLKPRELNRRTYLPGEVVALPDFLARHLIRDGFAEELAVPPPTPADATPEAPPAKEPAPTKTKAKADK